MEGLHLCLGFFFLLLYTWKWMVSHIFELGPFTLAKTNIQKTWVFCCTVYTARKTHNFLVFLARKAHARKNPESHTGFLISGAHARLISTFDRAKYVAGHRWFRRRSRPTKNPNNTGERGASVYIGKKPMKNRRSFKKPHFGGGFFDSVFCSV